MSGRLLRLSSAIGCATLLLSLAGCAMVTDLINPGFLSTLGVDPATVIRPQGRVVVAFQNNTSSPARLEVGVNFSETTTVEDYDGEMVMFEIIEANATQTRVVDCPVERLFPWAGVVYDGSSQEGLAVPYGGGDFLHEGDDFFCGDVVEISIVERVTAVDVSAGTTEVEYSIRVQVLPGR